MTESILTLPCRESEVALNPGLVAKPDGGYWLAYRKDCIDEALLQRRHPINSLQYWGIWKSVVVAELTSELKLTGRQVIHFEGEDPRLFHAHNKLWCSYASSPRTWRWWLMEVETAHHHEKLGEPFLPDYATNRYVIGEPEKNWTWIDNAAGTTFDCIYSYQPYRVLRFDVTGNRIGMSELEDSVSWPFGPIRGGSPSVLLPTGERVAAFHGYLSGGRYNRAYMAGLIYMEPMWPYRPIRVTQRPILIGRRRLKRWPWLNPVFPRNRVVYPCGIVAEPDGLLVSYGVDDCACAVAKFTYDELKAYDTGT
jgi:predicted GH43/DUF377 family glycosyl hydrolase